MLDDSLVYPTVFELFVAVGGSVITSLLALWYLRRVRLERPAIGVFNRRDISILFSFIVLLPLLYVVLPQWLLTSFLALTFTASLSIGLRPLMSTAAVWITLGLLLGVNIWMARNLLGTVLGWQIYWIENSIIVAMGAVAVSNLYAQGGMRLKHVAWFSLILAGYDAVFTLKWPVTNTLAERFLGYPLDPSVAFRMGIYNASIGMGDLLVYSLFLIIAYKAYGWAAARLSMVIIVIFGAVCPALAPLIFRQFIDARTDLVVPAQTAFGPIAFLLYLYLKKRYGRERTMVEFLASRDVPGHEPVPAPVPAAVPDPIPASA